MRHGVCFPSGGAFSALPSLRFEPILSGLVRFKYMLGRWGVKEKETSTTHYTDFGYSV